MKNEKEKFEYKLKKFETLHYKIQKAIKQRDQEN